MMPARRRLRVAVNSKGEASLVVLGGEKGWRRGGNQATSSFRFTQMAGIELPCEACDCLSGAIHGASCSASCDMAGDSVAGGRRIGNKATVKRSNTVIIWLRDGSGSVETEEILTDVCGNRSQPETTQQQRRKSATCFACFGGHNDSREAGGSNGICGDHCSSIGSSLNGSAPQPHALKLIFDSLDQSKIFGECMRLLILMHMQPVSPFPAAKPASSSSGGGSMISHGDSCVGKPPRGSPVLSAVPGDNECPASPSRASEDVKTAVSDSNDGVQSLPTFGWASAGASLDRDTFSRRETPVVEEAGSALAPSSILIDFPTPGSSSRENCREIAALEILSAKSLGAPPPVNSPRPMIKSNGELVNATARVADKGSPEVLSAAPVFYRRGGA